MEQPAGKKEKLILAAGLAAALALAAAQYFHPVSRALMAGRDVRLALLGERSSVLLVYHPSSETINAFTLSHPKPKTAVSGWQRAGDIAAQAGVREGADPEDMFYVSVSSAPDLEALWGALNNWRAEPRRFFSAVSWTAALAGSGATNLRPFDLFSLFKEFSGLSSSNFIMTELSRQPQEAEQPEEDAGPAPRVEVFNASGRKGLAAQVSKSLRALGFDVITEDSKPFSKHTVILGFSKDPAVALKLRSALGLDELEIHVRPSRKSVAGAAVVLGEDFSAARSAE